MRIKNEESNAYATPREIHIETDRLKRIEIILTDVVRCIDSLL